MILHLSIDLLQADRISAVRFNGLQNCLFPMFTLLLGHMHKIIALGPLAVFHPTIISLFSCPPILPKLRSFTTAKNFMERNNPPDKSAFAKASAGQAGGLSDLV
jgi:hypothetical protein